MSIPPLELVLSRLNHVHPSGDGFQASCPCHTDADPSLSISQGSDGRVLLKCFAGCAVEDIVKKIGLTMADLFVRSQPRGVAIRVSDLALDKKLPESFLRSLGLSDREDGVVVPYKLQDGASSARIRLRTALRAKNGSLWIFGKGPIVPYGLDRLADARAAGYLVFVEGESDCWTLWHHGFPAIGIPGADMTGKLEAKHLDGISQSFVVREPGTGGDTFIRGMAKRLQKLRWQGEARVICCAGEKDPNDLHRVDPNLFKTRFQSILDAAAAAPPVESPDLESERAVDSDPIRASGLDMLGLNPPLSKVEEALRKLAELLDGEDDLRRAVIREAAVAKLSSCGLKAPAKLLDGALGAATESVQEGQGRSLLLVAPTPWPESVDGAELLDEIALTIRRYVVVVEGVDVAVALWILHAHGFDAWSISPFLALISPEKRCGKTTLLDVVGALVPRKLPAANISPAALYRTVEIVTPTLLIDEADTFLNRNEDLRGILNAGHSKSTALVIRTVGDDHTPRQFSTWSPKVIASIGSLPSTIEDRSISIPMRRRARGESVERLRRDRLDGELEVLRRKAARWAADHLRTLREADPVAPSELHDRAQDNWRPLFAIADAAAGRWPGEARKAALALNGRDSGDDQSLGVRLLADVRALFQAESADQLPSEKIVKALLDIEDGPWAEYNKGRGLTVNGIAKLLKPFKVKPRTIRYFGKTPKGYRAVDFEDSFQRYLGFEAQQPQQPRNVNETALISNRNTDPDVAPRETQENTRNDDVVAGVAVEKPEPLANRLFDHVNPTSDDREEGEL